MNARNVGANVSKHHLCMHVYMCVLKWASFRMAEDYIMFMMNQESICFKAIQMNMVAFMERNLLIVIFANRHTHTQN